MKRKPSIIAQLRATKLYLREQETALNNQRRTLDAQCARVRELEATLKQVSENLDFERRRADNLIEHFARIAHAAVAPRPLPGATPPDMSTAPYFR